VRAIGEYADVDITSRDGAARGRALCVAGGASRKQGERGSPVAVESLGRLVVVTLLVVVKVVSRGTAHHDT